MTRLLTLILTAPLLATCTALLADAPCERDANCPSGQSCVDGTCAAGADPSDDDDGGEGEEGEGEEGEGEEGEGEEGEGEQAEGEGEDPTEGEGERPDEGEGENTGEEGEGEADPDRCFTSNDEPISSQEQLDALAGCETITGDLYVFGEGIQSFEALYALAEIDGSLIFEDIPLEALFGFTAVGWIDDDVEFYGTSFGFLGDGALQNLEGIGGTVTMADNPSLSRCDVQRLWQVAEGGFVDEGGNETIDDNGAECPP